MPQGGICLHNYDRFLSIEEDAIYFEEIKAKMRQQSSLAVN